jgi:hypothetical protein
MAARSVLVLTAGTLDDAAFKTQLQRIRDQRTRGLRFRSPHGKRDGTVVAKYDGRGSPTHCGNSVRSKISRTLRIRSRKHSCKRWLPVHVHLCALCVTCAVALFGFVSSAAAQSATRGELGAELHASIANTGGVFLWYGASAWYRVRPALALGMTAESGLVSTGGEGVSLGGSPGIDSGAKIFKAFVDYRLAPASPVGLFGRFSFGVADVKPLFPIAGDSVNREEAQRTEPIADLEAGPEFRIFLSHSEQQPRPALFLRLRATATLMEPRGFVGFGLALGGEG